MHLRQTLQGSTAVHNVPETPAASPVVPPPAAPAAAAPAAGAASEGAAAAPSPPTPTPGAAPAAGSAPVAAPPAAGAATPPAPPARTWKDDRIDELTAKVNEAKRQLAAAGVATPSQGAGESDADFDARVMAEATRIAAAREWDNQCNNVAKAGQAKFGETEFNARIAALQSIYNQQDPVEAQAYADVLSTAMETGKAHELLFALGANPGEMKRLMALTPMKRAMEMVTMAGKLQDVAMPSAVPAPITPIGSSGLHYEGIKPDDKTNGMKLPINEWMAQRAAQAKAAGIQ